MVCSTIDWMIKTLLYSIALIFILPCLVAAQQGNHHLLKYRNFLEQQSRSFHKTNDSTALVIKALKKDNSLIANGYAEELKAISTTDLDQKVQAYKDAILFYNSAGEILRLAEVYPTLVFLLQYYNRNGEAMEYATRTVEFSRKNASTPLLITSLVDLGKLLHQNKQFEGSKNLLLEAYQLHQKNQDIITNLYYQLGEVFILLNKTDSALYYLDKGLEWTKKVNQNEEALNLKVMKGKAYLYNNELNKAEDIFNQSFKEVENSPIQKSKLPSMYYLQTMLYNKQKRFTDAVQSAEKAIEYLKGRKNWRLISNIRSEKLTALQSLGKYKEANEEVRIWKQTIDSLQETEKKALFADAASRYETNKLQELITSQEVHIQTSKYRNRWILALLLLSIAATFAIYQFMKNKNQKTKHEAQLIKLDADRIKELDKVKSAFFTNISHEFRTPLTLIIEPLKTLDRELREGSHKNMFKRMRYAADAMLKLINEMLDLAKIESGKRKLKSEDGELTSFVKKLCFSVQSLADIKHINLMVQTPDNPMYLTFDRACLETIVVNLLNNAIKYTPEFGQVKLDLYAFQDQTVLSISDTGIGIDANDLPHIFDRYYRVENEENTMIGSGIGLALIKELVELHGGSIRVTSLINEGTTFVIHLPLKKCNAVTYEELQLDNSLPYATNHYTLTKNIGAEKILIVEDNAALSVHLKELLKDIEQVFIASNGIEGFEYAISEIPDIIITDLIMPEVDGMELISMLRNDQRTDHIPIILLTGNTEIENRIEGWKRGTDAYLNKPVVSEELLSVIENLIQQRVLLQQKYASGFNKSEDEKEIVITPESIFLKKVMEIIENHFEDEQFSVEILADQLHMSRSNLFRKVSAITGNNPTMLIRDYRLQRAMQLLKQGQSPKEVCYLTGFNSFSYFGKCFKDKFGIVPSSV